MAATALIVGCDGCLVLKPSGRKDSARRAAHAVAWREACAGAGLTWRDADFERLAGVPAADAFARLAAEQGVAGVDVAAAVGAKAVAQKRLSSGEPFAPAVAFARDAAAAGAAVALAADVRRDHAAAVLAKTGLAAVVRAVVARDAAEDAAGRLQAAAAALGAQLASCHVLAADDATLAAAQAAGCAGATDARCFPGYEAALAAVQGPPEPPPPPRLRGRVKSFNATKLYGFITPAAAAAGEPDVFVHQKDVCRPGSRALAVGEELEFWTEADAEGRVRARKVTAVGVAPWRQSKKKKRAGQGGKAGSALGAAAAAQRTGGGAMDACESDDGSDGMDTDGA